MKIRQFRYSIDNLAYVLFSKDQALAIDGGAVEKILRFTEKRGLSLAFVTNTHGHPDHTTGTGELLALDAKLDLDDNALYRHPDTSELRDPSQEDDKERRAHEHGLNYITLDGDIACMVNGAGLAMATMDIIKLAGAEPANFLDVGGGASAEMVENAFRIMLGDENVKGILINIFGGILRCDILAKGVVSAAEKTGINVPVVVRMEGTNVDEGRKILADSGLNLITAADMKDAAEKVAQFVADN